MKDKKCTTKELNDYTRPYNNLTEDIKFETFPLCSSKKTYSDTFYITLNTHSKETVLNIIENLNKNKNVLFAQPNFYYEMASSSIIPNTPYIAIKKNCFC